MLDFLSNLNQFDTWSGSGRKVREMEICSESENEGRVKDQFLSKEEHFRGGGLAEISLSWMPSEVGFCVYS